jgi:hypothetical protein
MNQLETWRQAIANCPLPIADCPLSIVGYICRVPEN